MSRVAIAAWIALALLGAAVSPAAAQTAKPVSEDVVHAVAAQLRCVVCQNLSVADSPSEMASQMRAIIRERLAAGESPAEVQRYFVDRYGEWILLSPPRRGFNLLVWLLPLAAVLVGPTLVPGWADDTPRSAEAKTSSVGRDDSAKAAGPASNGTGANDA